MDEKEIVVVIDTDGNVSVDAIGFHGEGCAEATKAITDTLGETLSEKKKPEYYEKSIQKEVHRIRQ